MATKELLHPLERRRAFQLSEKVDERSISIGRLFVISFTTAKSLSWKGVVKFLVCTFIVPCMLFSAYCPVWLALQSDTNTEKSIGTVLLCPCRVSTTWDEKQLGFNADPACDARKSGYWNCRFHQGAKGCYRRKSTTSAAGAQCCYDSNGEWISDWRKGAGTVDFYYPSTWKNFSTYQHFFSDVLSYFSCCIGATTIFNSCEQYMRYRPAGKCDNVLLARACRNIDPNLSILESSLCRSNEHGENSPLKSSDAQREVQANLPS
jgi:hypothetical protein